MAKLTIEQLDLARRRVFVRADLNAPLDGGAVTDDTRLRAVVPTIQYALKAGAAVVLASHLGRPGGRVAPEFSLRPVAARLEALLGQRVELTPDCVGPETLARARALGAGELLLLENLRFHAEEEANDDTFARELAALADCYVNDAFAAAHRAHASIAAITKHLQPAAAGLLLQQELAALGRILEAPERPLVAILGGAKVSDKLALVEHLLTRVDALLIGGGMAFTFLRSLGHVVGRSLVEEDLLDPARDVERRAKERNLRFELPSDHVVAPKLEANVPVDTLAITDPAIGDRMGLDIGPKTIETYKSVIQGARTVVWNGPMGVFEIDAFAKGTVEVARAVAAVKGTTIIGGGDSIAAVAKAGVTDRITHISTGGGASLEFLGGRKLPGVEALA